MEITRRGFLKTAAAGVAAASGISALPVAAQVTSFKLGLVVLGDFGIAAPPLVAIEKGFFKDNGVAVEVIPFRGGPDLLKGVLAGSVEMGVTGATDPLVFRERGTGIRTVAVTVEKNHFTLVAAPRINRLEDLKGESIGVTVVGATTWVFARLLARKMGWDTERDVKIVALGGMDAQVAALSRGEIAAFVWGDGGAVVEVQGKGKVLMRLDMVTPKWISELAYSTDDVIRAKKETLQKVVRGLFQGIKFCRENPEETIRIAAKGIGWPEAATRKAYELVRPLLSVDGRIDVDALRLMQDTLLELGVLKKRLPLEEHYTTEFTPVRL